jgi:Na+/proline symporter
VKRDALAGIGMLVGLVVLVVVVVLALYNTPDPIAYINDVGQACVTERDFWGNTIREVCR